jgi:hypothetical protein
MFSLTLCRFDLAGYVCGAMARCASMCVCVRKVMRVAHVIAHESLNACHSPALTVS